MRLDAKAFALASGVVWGVVVFLATNLSLLRHGGETLSKLEQVYPWYNVSFVGSIIGLVWGFVTMFVLGWVLVFLYNKFSKPGSVA